MHVLLIYDISNDRIRSKISCACEDYGLDRIQFSAFYGQLSWNHQDELMLKIAALLDDTQGHVQLIPIGHTEWDKRLEINTNAG